MVWEWRGVAIADARTVAARVESVGPFEAYLTFLFIFIRYC